jgi:hypothetical protein
MQREEGKGGLIEHDDVEQKVWDEAGEQKPLTLTMVRQPECESRRMGLARLGLSLLYIGCRQGRDAVRPTDSG